MLARVFKVLAVLILIAALTIGAAAGWLAWRFKATTPQVAGIVEIAGIESPIEILRDDRGVPHIFGAADEDVYFGLGFAHAQDRFFQMDLTRRFMQGRLSEVLGPSALRSDARARTRGWGKIAEAHLAGAAQDTRDALEAYAAGVNARLAQGAPSPEYAVLLFEPEPWRPVDSLAVSLSLTLDLVVGQGDDLARQRLAAALSPDKIAAFLGGYPAWAPRSLDAADLGLAAPGADLEPATPDAGPAEIAPVDGRIEDAPQPGSNNWVVSGELTASGAPLLANDPHLAIGSPSIWYFARLAHAWGDVVGGTIPGLPFVVLGRTNETAWGFTNNAIDVEDFRVFAPGEAAIETVEETITVRGLFAPTVETITIGRTKDGVVLDPKWFDVAAFGEGAVVVLKTTADDPDAKLGDAIMGLARARSFEDFAQAVRGWTAPLQSMVYADVRGDIGYISPGRYPARDADGVWSGEWAIDDALRVKNPASGVIATANNQIAPEAFPRATPGDYADTRIARILDRLAVTRLHDKRTFAALQNDVRSVRAERLLATLQRATPSTAEGSALQALLQGWDGEMASDRIEPLVYALWIRALYPSVVADELGEAFVQFPGPRTSLLDRVFNEELSAWCDDLTTEGVESCNVVAGRAFDVAARLFEETYGEARFALTWGDVHQAAFNHPLMSGLPVLKGLYAVSEPVGGDGSTVNVAHYPASGSFEVNHAASMRAIYDLSDLDGSLFIHAPGQSGHPLSPHYRDLAGPWARGEYFEIRTDWDMEAPPPGLKSLTLAPKDQSARP